MSVRFQGPKPGSFGCPPRDSVNFHPEVLEIKKGMEFKAKKPTEVWRGRGVLNSPSFIFGVGNVFFPQNLSKGKKTGEKKKHTLIQTTSHNKINKI